MCFDSKSKQSTSEIVKTTKAKQSSSIFEQSTNNWESTPTKTNESLFMMNFKMFESGIISDEKIQKDNNYFLHEKPYGK